jgi:glucose/mannose-6-phosphate isomerase
MHVPEEYKQIHNIVVAGMGGSRFTPRIVKELYYDSITLPYELVDTYALPRYVRDNSLVILSSYSGTTEEVISCGLEAMTRHAKVMGICKGGTIGNMLIENNLPRYLLSAKYNPCGQPRIGGGYLLMGHIGFLKTLGFLGINDEEVENAISYVREFTKKMLPDVPTEKNPAKQLALKLYDMHPFLIGAEFLRGYVNGFANQINETAKLISDYRHIPELNHHLLEGLKSPSTIHDTGLFVFVNSNLYREPIRKRFEITKEVVEKQHVATHTVTLQGDTKLSQILEGLALSGFTTFYLAMMYNLDPVAIPWVDYFKQKLSS